MTASNAMKTSKAVAKMFSDSDEDDKKLDTK